MIRTKEEVLATLRACKLELQKAYPIKRMALFGSLVREEAVEGSDVDILIDVDPSIGLRFVSLAEQLEEVLGLPVDLVSRRAIKPSLWEKIERELIDV